MAPADYDVHIYEAEDFEETFTVYDAVGQVIDLTGYTAEMKATIKSTGKSLFSISTADYITLGGAAGTITIDVPQSVVDTWDFRYNRGIYELTLIDGSGDKELYLRGTVFLYKKVA